MSTSLHQELAALAQGARSYADAEAALDRARWIRLRRRITPAVAAVALAAVAAAVWVTVPLPADAPSRPLPAGPPAYPGLPPLVEPPAGPVPPLPTDTAVGEAALAYQCRGCPGYLVLPDGSHYRLDDYADRDGGRQVALSPDGRWLGLDTADGFLVRDLTGTAQWTFEGFVGTAWSPGSRWLLGFFPVDDSYAVVDTATGELTRARGAAGGALGLSPQVLDSGELVVVDDRATAGNRLVLRIVDPLSGERQRTVQVDTRPALRPGEATTIPDPQVDSSQATVLVGGRGIGLVPVVTADEDQVDSPRRPVLGVLLVSLDDGQLVGRVDAPPDAQLWLPTRFDGELVLGFRAPEAPGGRWELVAHHPDGGAVDVVSRADGWFIHRGTAEWLLADPDPDLGEG